MQIEAPCCRQWGHSVVDKVENFFSNYPIIMLAFTVVHTECSPLEEMRGLVVQ